MAGVTDLRQACDRCHGKKLKCTRQNDSNTCMRCLKANTDCIFSPITRPNRFPPSGASASSSSVTTSELGTAWFTGYPTSAQPNGEGVAGAVHNDQGLASLPQLMSTLDTIWHGMPAADACHISLQDVGTYLGYIAGASFIGSVLDQVLAAAQQLQKAYSAATQGSQSTDDASSRADCTMDKCVHLSPSPPARHADFTTLTLLTACHLRLLDILGNIAKHGKLCLDMANAVPPADRPQFLLPHMQMGSFVVPQDKMASMIITMLIDQQQGLVKAVTQLGRDTKSEGEEGDVSFKRMFEVQNVVLLERATSILNDFKEMGNIFANIDLFGPNNGS